MKKIILISTLALSSTLLADNLATISQEQRQYLEKKISSCSIIAFATYNKDGGATQSVISEYLYVKDGAKPSLEIGEVFHTATDDPNFASRGEGAILYFRSSMPNPTGLADGGAGVHNGKVEGITLEQFKELCKSLL